MLRFSERRCSLYLSSEPPGIKVIEYVSTFFLKNMLSQKHAAIAGQLLDEDATAAVDNVSCCKLSTADSDRPSSVMHRNARVRLETLVK